MDSRIKTGPEIEIMLIRKYLLSFECAQGVHVIYNGACMGCYKMLTRIFAPLGRTKPDWPPLRTKYVWYNDKCVTVL